MEGQALALWQEFFERNDDPSYADDWGDRWCFFCGEWQISKEGDHKEDCVYIRARALVEAAKQAEEVGDEVEGERHGPQP